MVSILSKEENDALYNSDVMYKADVWLGLQDNREFYIIGLYLLKKIIN